MTELTDIQNKIKKNFSVTDANQSVILALMFQQNLILKKAFMISADNNHPGALEAIGMVLGMAEDRNTILDTLVSMSNEITDELNTISLNLTKDATD